MSTYRPKPSAHVKGWHTAAAITKVQAERLRRGIKESTPDDYRPPSTDEPAMRRAAARRTLDDRAMERRLLDPLESYR